MPVFFEEVAKIDNKNKALTEGSKDEEECKAPKSAVKLSALTRKLYAVI